MNNDNNIFDQYAELVRKFKSGDESAFTDIYENSKKLVYTTCLGILNNEQDAEDAMQETYLTVYEKIGTLDAENTFVTWLKTIAANKARDKFKAKKNDASYDDILATEDYTEGDDNLENLPDSIILEKDKRDTFYKILRKALSDEQFQTTLLYYYDELPVAQIAKIMECPENTVKSKLRLARVKIKAGIEDYEKKNNISLLGAIGTGSLGTFFNAYYNTARIPTIHGLPIKLGTNANGASGKAAAKAATKTGNLAKNAGAASGTGTKAGVLASPVAKIGIALAAVAVIAVPTAIIVNNVKNNPEDVIVETTLVTDTVDSEVEYPVDIPLDQVPEYDQLSTFVNNWRKDTSDSGWKDKNVFNEWPNVDLSLYFAEDSSPYECGVTDPRGKIDNTDNCYSINPDHLAWTAKNILNYSDEDIDKELSRYEVYSDGYIYLSCQRNNLLSLTGKISSIQYDGNYYYIHADRYSPFDNLNDYDYYYVMELKNIDGKDYWTLISCGYDEPAITSDSNDATGTNTATSTDTTGTDSNSTNAPANTEKMSRHYSRKTETYYKDGNVTIWVENEYYESNQTIKKSKTSFYNDGFLDYYDESEYNESGIITREIDYDYYDDGRVNHWREFEFDASGKEIKTMHYFADNSLDFWTINEFDESGNRIKETAYHTDGSASFWIEYEYDGFNNLIKETTYYSYDEIMRAEEYEYDPFNNKIKFVIYDKDNTIISHKEYEYDTNNNMSKEIDYNADGSINSWIIYERDERTRVIKKSTYNADGSIKSWTEYERNKYGHMVKETTYNADGSIKSWIEHEYDEYNNEIKSTTYNADGSITAWTDYEYVYD